MNKYVKLNDKTFYSPENNNIFVFKNAAETNMIIENNAKFDNEKLIDYFTTLDKIYPTSISLFLSSGCNLRCNYCYYSSGNKMKDLSKEQLDIIINYLVKNACIKKISEQDSTIDVILTGGGEPTFNWKNFTYFVDNLKNKCKKYKIKNYFLLVTNGVLSEQKCDYIEKNIDEIQFSFDGLPEFQNLNRKLKNGNNSFNCIDKSLNYFANSKRLIAVRTTVTPESSIKMDQITKFVFEKYPFICQLQLEPMDYAGRANENVSSKFNIDFVKNFIEIQKKYGEKVYCSIFDYNNTPVPCSSITGYTPIINNNGFFMPCSDRLQEKQFALGKLENGKIVSSEKSPFKDYYLKILNSSCSECKWYFQCGGGCPSKISRYSDGSLSPNGIVFCDMIKYYWDYFFKNLLEQKYVSNIVLKKNNRN